MAENVIISAINFGPNLPKWSTEATMLEIQDELKKLNQNLTGKSNNQNRNNNQENTLRKKMIEDLEELGDQAEKTSGVFDKLGKNLNEGSEEVSDSLEKLRANINSGYTGMSGLVNVVQSLGSTMKTVLTPGTALGGSLGLAGFALESFANYITNTTQTILGLYNSGITFQGGLSELRLAAAQAVLPLDVFSKLIVENSAVIKGMGVDGTTSFAMITRGTLDLVAAQGRYGMSIEEVGQFTADNLELLRTQGLLNKLSDSQRAQSSAEYIKQLTAYSQIMGRSREEISRSIIEQSKLPELIAKFGSLPEAQKKQAEQSLKEVTGVLTGALGANNPLQEALVSVASGLNDYDTELVKTLAATRPDLARRIVELGNALGEGAVGLEDDTVKLLQDIQKTGAGSMQSIIGAGESSLRQGALQFSNIVGTLGTVNISLEKIAEAAKPGAFEMAMLSISTTFAKARAKFSELFGSFLEAAQPRLTQLAEWLEGMVTEYFPRFQAFFDELIKLFDPKERDAAWARIYGDLSSGISTVMQFIADHVVTAISDAIDIALGFQSREERPMRRNLEGQISSKIAADPGQSEKLLEAKSSIESLLSNADLATDTAGFFGDRGNKIELDRAIAMAKENNLDLDSILAPILNNPEFKDYYESRKKRFGYVAPTTSTSPILQSPTPTAGVSTTIKPGTAAELQNANLIPPTVALGTELANKEVLENIKAMTETMKENNELLGSINNNSSRFNQNIRSVDKTIRSSGNVVK